MRVQLGPISDSEAIVLLKRLLEPASEVFSGEAIDNIISEAGGNVRLLVEAARSLSDGLHDRDARLFLTLNRASLDTDLAVDLLTALNELYRAYGGLGLKIEDGESREFRMKGVLV